MCCGWKLISNISIMQMRSAPSPSPAAAEENVQLLRESIRLVKRESPIELGKILVMFILLGAGMILGVMFALHMPQYVTPVTFFSSNSMALCRQNLKPNPSPSPSPSPSLEIHQWMTPQDWLRGRSSIRHNMPDSELLWLASMAPMMKGMPISRVAKVAFMFLTKGPLPLAPLWERFFKGNEGLYSIYVHTHPGFLLDVPSSSVFYRREIRSKDVRWGDITLYDAERRLLANALLDFANERFILLSETCIPVYAFPIVYSHLILSNTSLIGAFDERGPCGRGRYNRNMMPLVSIEQWRKGSQWFEVNRKHAIYIVSDTLYYPKFREFCKNLCYVDEHYLPTMLSIEFGSLIENRSVTWVDWSRGGPHPAMFGKGDITKEFITRIREQKSCSYNGHLGAICFLFARKFSPNSLDPLLQLASEIMGI